MSEHRIFVFFIAALVCSGSTAVAEHRPTVKKQQFTFHFLQGKNDALQETIVSTDGNPLYRLECADPDGSKKLPTASEVWSGDMECHLLSIKQENPPYVSLLLSRSDRLVSASRAVFMAYMLEGECARYPDWGLVRQFRLRGMKIVLALSDVVSQPYSSETHYEGIKSAILTVSVSPDPTAMSPLALPSRYAEPKVLNPEESDFNKYRVEMPAARLRWLTLKYSP